LLIALCKPYRTLSQFTPDGSSNATLRDCCLPAGVHPIGRLDADTEGLLLLTDEPGWENRLLHPKQRHPKTYLAQVDGAVEETSLRPLKTGLKLKTECFLPVEVALIPEPDHLPPRYPPVRFRKSVPTTWLEVILQEGRNRQIRRMTAAIGFPTLRLIRTAIGNYHLTDLTPGSWTELTETDRKALT